MVTKVKNPSPQMRGLPSRQEIHQRLLSAERDISTWLIPGEPYRTYDLDFENIFEERFLEAGPWTIGSTEGYDLELCRWGYRFRNKKKGSQFTFLEKKVDPARPWGVEMDIQAVEVSPGALFGILFGLDKATNDQMIFVINPINRVFYVSKHEKKMWGHLARREFTPAVGDWHTTLRVDQVEGYWQYFVDEWLVYCHPAETLPGLGFGIIISQPATIDNSRLKVQW